MTLTLKIRNFDRLENGMPTEFVLHQRGALIGRSPTCDWSLPDPRAHISSRHCEVSFVDGFYLLTDISMNGTFLNGSPERMAGPRRIEQGDVFAIGQYEVAANLSGAAVAAMEREAEAAIAAQQSNWRGWDSAGGAAPSAAPPDGGWGAPAPAPTPAAGGWDAAPAPSSDWGAAPAPSPSPSAGWGPAAAPSPASGWDAPAAPSPAPSSSWDAPNAGWSPPASPAASSGWGVPPSPPAAPPAPSGWAPSGNMAPPPVASAWEPHVERAQEASPWSSAAPDRPPTPSPDDVWGKIADGNVVDWARGGFGTPQPERRDPLGLEKPVPTASFDRAPPRMAAPPAASGWGAPTPAPAPAPPPLSGPAPVPTAPPPVPTQPPAPMPAAQPASAETFLESFARAAGIEPGQVQDRSPATVARAGQLFRKIVAGLVVMLEARARAKSQLGAEMTAFDLEGNNPLKFARTPEEAVVALLNPKARGFMDAERAIEDAYFDLQSHQMATLKAMQGALRATLDRFSPAAIKKRAETGGLLARILPGSREAALWQAYEKEFGGVAQGSDEAFMDVFAKEFRRAYEESARAQRKR